MSEWIVTVFLLIGGGLLFIAAVGVLRMPDLYTRMQAATKAGTLGMGLLLAAAGVAFADVSVTITVSLTIAFFLLTVPVAAHMIGRAAYLAGLRPWSRTRRDEDSGAASSTLKRR